ncbi:hypothetical protein G7Z17_g11880 [Cylindrodendrum hubeiense]|uniref:Uncharacterized protein n=1 Tax=Cylindrodendrum hubeiense TaxID=595255 RepID=A0A9P5H1Z9_9HYPO|nr:hypothetical protein G7Z17_g11880 [Cylindrodendrum hubeiense]
MTRGHGLRQYRAQSLGEPGKPPCAKCVREGAECILAGSRRGGDFSHLRRGQQQKKGPRQVTTPSTSSTDHTSPRQAKTGEEPVHDNLQNPYDALLILAHTAGQSGNSTYPEVTIDDFNNQGHGENIDGSIGLDMPSSMISSQAVGRDAASAHSLGRGLSKMDDPKIRAYPPIKDGTIDPALLIQLLHLYRLQILLLLKTSLIL